MGKSSKRAASATTATKPSPKVATSAVTAAQTTGQEPKAKVGRPAVIRTKENATKICALLAEGMSLRAICRMEGMPSKQAVLEWLSVDAEFAAQYARAREDGADEMADELLEIADDGSNDWMERENKDGSVGWVLNGEHVQRSKLRVDTRKWLMSKMRPKKYGDNVAVTGPGGGPIQVAAVEWRVVDPRKGSS